MSTIFRTILRVPTYMCLLVMLPALFTVTSCAKKDYNTISVVKPKTKKRPYNPKKDKGKKRLRKVRVQN